MRILHVLDHSVPLHSGYSFRTLAILREQRALGWETAHVTSTKHYGATVDEEEVDGLHFYRTRTPQGGYRSLPVLGQLAVITDLQRRLEPLIAQLKPDLIHAHSPCLNGIAALRAARDRRIPVVYEMRASWEDAAVDHGKTTEGSLRYRISRAIETWTLRHAHAVTTICEGLRKDIESRGIDAGRVTVIPNAVDPGEFRVIESADAELAARYRIRSGLTLGFIGSFYGYEGLEYILDAMPAILAAEPDARLLLVGGGPDEDRLKAQAQALGLGDRVIFAGRVPHGEVARYYSLIDLLVYPRKSIRLTETVTPLKPLEAMAQGRLLIASNVGGHRELIEDGKTGFLFAADDPGAIVDAVKRVVGSQGHWSGIRAAGRQFVERERNWSYSVARYRSVYEQALAAARQA